MRAWCTTHVPNTRLRGKDTKRPIVAVTLGDPCGIGPEVVVKALASRALFRLCRPVVIGSEPVVQSAIRLTGVPLQTRRLASVHEARGEYGTVEVLQHGSLRAQAVPMGKISEEAGKASVEWVLRAGQLCLSGEAMAMATAPINKEAAKLAGSTAVGHMELLQELTGSTNVATMLMTKGLRVVHLTTHRSLRQACEAVTVENVRAKLELTHRQLKEWGLPRPCIGVAALNPHASDGGLLGDEEQQQIAPAIAQARAQGIDATGPIPADVVFHQAITGRYDVVLAMYHDQGHVAIKVHGFEESISVTLGLPFVRTSVDHGTAFDIAGKGTADARSMTGAIRVAALLARSGRLP
ncbi:MAG: 4-hydroxythreonine-4-phosphate dehydrogenase PdxA [Dehalococcoidia bacterium]|nr:4-hydroxythreonine-4-phosphate dehydrogenase PdxA [Dehalococcoidia bacterium]